MLLFWSEEHVEKWCRDWNLPRGEVLSLDQCWRLAKAWHGRVAWSRPTGARVAQEDRR
jgi:hypothetical protein